LDSIGQGERLKTCWLFALAILIILISQPLCQAEITRVYVKPKEVNVENGKVFEIEIVANPSTQIAGYQFSIGYDSSVLDFLAVREGNFFRKHGLNTYFYEGNVDRTAGVLRDVVCVVLGEGGSSENGTLAIVRFRAKKTGQSTITLFDVIAGNPLGEQVEVNVQGGSVKVFTSGIAPWLVFLVVTIVIVLLVLIFLLFRRRSGQRKKSREPIVWESI